MVFGTAKFKCDKCGERFEGVAAEWNATASIAPVQCPKCGSMHTYPVDSMTFWGIFGPPYIYKKIIWKAYD